jgi:hypothetical protein
MWALVTILVWVLEIVVWYTLVIPLIVRPLGVRLPAGAFQKQQHHWRSVVGNTL